MKLHSVLLICYIVSSNLNVVTHGLDIGPACENGVEPVNCTLRNGNQGFAGELCNRPNPQDANVWCHIKTQHLFELYYCCEEVRVIATSYAVGALKTEPEEFPYMAALGWYSLQHITNYDFKCGAVMISNKFVLTAAHCANVDGHSPIMVLPGGSSLADNFGLRFTIDEVIVHPEYKEDFVYNDVALIKLFGIYNGSVVDIWRQPSIPNTNFTAIGYGDTTFGGTSSEDLLKVFLQLIAKSECQRYYAPDFEIPDGVIGSQICAKDLKEVMDTCQGDSGGPLIMAVNGTNGARKEYLVGITSFGQGCALSPPGLYTRVSSYIGWIDDVTKPKRAAKQIASYRKGCRFFWLYHAADPGMIS